ETSPQMNGPMSNDPRDLLALQLVPRLGPRRTAALIGHFGSAARVRQATAEQLQKVPNIGSTLADDITHHLRTVDVDAGPARMAKKDVRLLVLGTPEYPPGVASITDAPHLLYVRGTLTAADANAVAVVGSRHCTEYGKRAARQIAMGLARAGVCVVSGLAR